MDSTPVVAAGSTVVEATAAAIANSNPGRSGKYTRERPKKLLTQQKGGSQSSRPFHFQHRLIVHNPRVAWACLSLASLLR
jgi:hypothetical protein